MLICVLLWWIGILLDMPLIYFAVIAAILAIVFAVINKRTFYYT